MYFHALGASVFALFGASEPASRRVCDWVQLMRKTMGAELLHPQTRYFSRFSGANTCIWSLGEI